MSFIRMAALAGFSTALIATGASSETFRDHFMTNWDLDSNGAVTLAEVKERRESVFAAFDSDDDGFLDTEERAVMDEMRDAEHARMAAEGMQRPRGNGQHRMGTQAGMGQGHGMGHGFRKNAEAGMHGGRMIDRDNDGKFSREEFVGMSERWMAHLDNNGDGEISGSDF